MRIRQCHWATRVLGILKIYISLLPCVTLHIYINICSKYLHNLLYNESSQSSTVTWNVEKTIKSMQYFSFYFNDITQRFRQREREREREREEQPLNKKDLQSFITAIKRPFGLSFLITQFSVSITHNSNDGTHSKKIVWQTITLFSLLNSLIFELWVIEIENTFWLFSVSITHNSMTFL